MQTYTITNFCRKVAFVLLRNFKLIAHLFRQLRCLFYTKCWVRSILGKVYFNTICNSFVIGKDATFYPYVVFELSESSRVTIGNNFTFSYGAIFSCRGYVSIGNYVMIGEYCSIRDSTHMYENNDLPYCKQADRVEKIEIGNNVWIGRSCVVLPGSIIEDNVIIGAHSVVKGHLKANCMYAGSPLKLIREMAKSSISV